MRVTKENGPRLKEKMRSREEQMVLEGEGAEVGLEVHRHKTRRDGVVPQESRQRKVSVQVLGSTTVAPQKQVKVQDETAQRARKQWKKYEMRN